MQTCPCGSKNNYADCCGIFIENRQSPQTPEQLMRSRYTAYTLANIDYILRTMKSPAADGFNPVEARKWAKQVNWLQLNVVKSSTAGNMGEVEFIAYFAMNNKKHTLHELSKFQFENGSWYYVDGKQLTP